jgi:murein DD-endopeptidase MepM/ murein hydrolase activator NlpD
MPRVRSEPTAGAAGRRRLPSGLLVAAVIVVLGQAPVALGERSARAASVGGHAPALPVSAPLPAVSAALPAGRVPALRMPLAGPVVRGFELPAGPFGPGHRGVDVGARVGEVVRAPAAGRVVFAGPVAGTSWVTLLVAPGVMVTVGPLLPDRRLAAGRVRALAVVGRVGLGHGEALHLSLRVDGVYVDPLRYLVDRPRPRLAPLLAPGGLPGPAP